MEKGTYLLFSLLGIVIVLTFVGFSYGGNGLGLDVTVYKSSGCGCCVGHIAFMEGFGFDVDAVNLVDTQSIKQRYNIPAQLQSCHTSIVEDYFVEGHVPIEAINKLLEEKPDIDGIALPRMPAGSPGMPGIKTSPFVIYAIKDGVISEFMRI